VHPPKPRSWAQYAHAGLLRRGNHIPASSLSLPVPNALIFVQKVDACESNTRYFKRKRNAAGLIGFTAHQNISAVMRIFAYDIPMDYADEYLRIGDDTTMESVPWFCKVMIRLYGPTYL
jgi:hypothetical protein